MRNQDKRFDRYMNDSRFAQIVRLIESLFYSDSRVTYSDLLDAAFVARIRYETHNPSIKFEVHPEGTWDFLKQKGPNEIQK